MEPTLSKAVCYGNAESRFAENLSLEDETMSQRRAVTIPALLATFLAMSGPLSGCTLFAGAAAGAGGYEAHQASEMNELEEDYKAGRISKEEYEARKDQIDESSVTQ